MKIKIFLFLLTGLFCLDGYSQDPMSSIRKSKTEKDKDEQKLTATGKAQFEKAKAEFKNIRGATFELAANEISNEDPKKLVSIPAGTPENTLATGQNDENKKNLKAINDKLKTDSKVSNAELNFTPTATPTSGVGASWTDSWYWKPAYHTPVKNMGACGACWAFAVCAAFEHTYKKWWGIQLDLSEQDMIACGTTCTGSDVGSCVGGWATSALSFLKCKGIASEATYPYTASNGPCLAKPKFKSAYTWGQIYHTPALNQRNWIKYYITIYGSVVTYMKGCIPAFFSYGGGPFNGYPNTSPSDIDNVTTIVGWYEPWQSWIIKNSWGPGWGPYGGYAYVRYDNCNIGNYAYYVYPNK